MTYTKAPYRWWIYQMMHLVDVPDFIIIHNFCHKSNPFLYFSQDIFTESPEGHLQMQLKL